MARKSRITGASEMAKVLKLLPGKVQGKLLISATRAGANLIRNDARARAPESGLGAERRAARSSSGEDYGTLKDNISVKKVKTPPSRAKMIISNGRAFWGMFLEFGTEKHPPQPWLRPAFDGNVSAALAKIGKTLGRGIEREATKLTKSFAKSGQRARRR